MQIQNTHEPKQQYLVRITKKSIENTKTTLKEHEKEQRKKWNNKATQRMNIQEKYTICFESGIDNTVYRHLKMEHYSTFDKNIPATCHSAALLWYIQYNQRYTCTCILKNVIYWIYWNLFIYLILKSFNMKRDKWRTMPMQLVWCSEK